MVSVVVTNISFNRSVKLHVVFGLLIGNVYRPIKEFWGGNMIGIAVGVGTCDAYLKQKFVC